MAKDTKLSGGMIPGTDLPKHQPSDFDRLVGDNIHRAVIGTPTGDGVVPLGGTPPNLSNILEIPAGTTPQQAALLQSAFKSIMEGKALSVATGETNAVAQPPMNNRDAIVPEANARMWNPYQSFVPHAKLSDMERSVPANAINPTAVIAGVPVSTSLKPKVDCSPVILDCYGLLDALVKGRWFLPGCALVQTAETMLIRLKGEIEG